jgi:diamine N-acetyltransferase
VEPVQIREARPEDVDLLFKMQRAAALAGFAHIFPPDKYPFPDEAERSRWIDIFRFPNVSILIAQREEHPVGGAVIGREELARFFVVPERWGSGVADVLHDAVLQTLREQGNSTVCRLWVLEENHRARRFYERRGWSLDERRRPGSFPPFPVMVGYSRGVDLSEETYRTRGDPS